MQPCPAGTQQPHMIMCHAIASSPPEKHAGAPAQVLGTFITEWEEGSWQCEIFLADLPTAERAAKQLARIAAYYRFEGWLINIENELQQTAVQTNLYYLR